MSLPLIPRHVLFGNPDKEAPQISPDGSRIAYLAPDEGVLNVWVRSREGGDDRPVTSDRGRGIRVFLWQEDSEHIIFLQDRDGDENWHLHQADIHTRATRDFTPFEHVQAQPIAREWRRPNELLVGLNVRDARLHDVHRLNLTTGDLTLDTENPGDVSGWAADSNLAVRAATAMTPDGGISVRVRATPADPWVEFERWGPDETFGGVVGFSPDDGALRMISSVGANAARLIEVDVATRELRVLAEDPQFDVANVLVDRRTHEVQAVQFVRTRSEWTVRDPAVADDFAAISGQQDADIAILSRDLDLRYWSIGYVDDDAPVRYCVYERARRATRELFVNRPALLGAPLSPMRPISFAARDGLMLSGYLTVPRNAPPAAQPMILLVHGGPWARDVWGLSNEVQWLANRGYAVLQVNYRGSTGYGKAFVNAGDREWAGRMHVDLLDAKRWAVDQGIADPARVGIYGGSYGGYAVLVALTFTPEEFACGVDIVGPSSLLTLIRSIPPYWVPMRALFDKRVGHVETEEEFLRSRSPLFRADAIRRPLLIAQGANDPRVKQAESDQIVAAMRQNGQEVEYLVFADEGHGFARPENRLRFYAAAEHFLARHLGGRVEPPAPHEDWKALEK